MDDQPLILEMFTDYVCPWCYLSTAAIKQLRAKHERVVVRHVPFPLHPDTPQQGITLEALFKGRDMTEAHRRLRQLMAEAGLEYSDRSMTYNSRLAQELGKWADQQPGGEALHDLLYRAYFVHQNNLAEKSVLLEAVAEAGLPVAEAEKVIDTRSHAPAVDADWQRARAYQISSVPTFLMGNYLLPGSQPWQELLKLVHYVEDQQARM